MSRRGSVCRRGCYSASCPGSAEVVWRYVSGFAILLYLCFRHDGCTMLYVLVCVVSHGVFYRWLYRVLCAARALSFGMRVAPRRGLCFHERAIRCCVTFSVATNCHGRPQMTHNPICNSTRVDYRSRVSTHRQRITHVRESTLLERMVG